MDGGDVGNSYYESDRFGNVGAFLQGGVVRIFSTRDAFAALKADGSVVAWGDGQAAAVALAR